MKLDRNINRDGTGKYALLKLRFVKSPEPETSDVEHQAIQKAINTLDAFGLLSWGNSPDTDFFVIRLRDQYAAPALAAYAMAAFADDQEYAVEILNLARKAAEHPNKKKPD